MANVIFASGGSNVGAKSPLAKWIMPPIKRQRTRFPEIPIEQFKRAVAFIEPDGEAFFAAEAVYRSLRYRSSRKWLAWSYDHVPGFAGDFRDRLQIHRSASRSRISRYPIVMGQRRAAADLFLGASLVSPHAWTHLSDRVRVSLGASGWTCWQQRNVARKSVSPCSSAATWARRLFRSCQHFAGSTRATPFYISFAVAALFFRCF